MSSLRALLRETPPRDFPVKAAWTRVIQLLRANRRTAGRRGQLSSRGAVESALDATVAASPEQLVFLKTTLRTLARELGSEGDGQAQDLAVAIDELVTELLPAVAVQPVAVQVEGWPADFGADLQERLLRRSLASLASLAPEEAAALVREFDGMVLGGARLSVTPLLEEGAILPTVPRDLRARPMLRGRRGAWLPHLDEEGRRSLTPRPRAQAQAALVATDVVIDGYCGCGGNAIAFALAGLRVVAVERDAQRLELARRNAEHMGVHDRISFHCGELQDLLPALLDEYLAATVFLDPPWRGGDSIEDVPRWPDLLPGGATTAALLPPRRALLLKLPRSFDLMTLPQRTWQLSWGFGEGLQSSSVLMLTLSSSGESSG
jgi:hypothetical protein